MPRIKTVTTSEVPSQWVKGIEAQNNGGAFRTDGSSLFSYNKRIGITTPEGKKVLFEYTARSGHGISSTTSGHVGKARHLADTVLSPSVLENTDIAGRLPF